MNIRAGNAKQPIEIMFDRGLEAMRAIINQ